MFTSKSNQSAPRATSSPLFSETNNRRDGGRVWKADLYVSSNDGYKSTVERVALPSANRVHDITGMEVSHVGGLGRTHKVQRVAAQRDSVEAQMMAQANKANHRERYARAYAQR